MKMRVGVAILSLLMAGTSAIGVSPALAQTPIDVQMTAPAQGSTLRPGPVVVEGRLNGLTATETTSVVFAIDVSGSTNDVAGDCNDDRRVDSNDDLNGDRAVGTVLDCEIAGAQALVRQMVSRPDVEVGLVGFGSSARVADMSPATGWQPFSGPAIDYDRNGGRDVEQVLTGLQIGRLTSFAAGSVGTGTDFTDALAQSEYTLRSSAAIGPEYVLFLSDGEASTPSTTTIDRLASRGAIVQTFAIGGDFRGDPCGVGRPLRTIADRTGGTCSIVSDPTNLVPSLTGSIGAIQTQISVYDSNGKLWQTKPGGASVLGEFRTVLSWVPRGTWTVEVVASGNGSTGSSRRTFTIEGSDTPMAQATSVAELSLSADFTAEHANVLRLYWAFFNRDPDLSGAKYWIGISKVASLDTIAIQFAASAEFKQTYGSVDDRRYVEILYGNVLGRTPDAGGFNYWYGLVIEGKLTRGSVVRWVSASQEFKSRKPYPTPPPAPAIDSSPGVPVVTEVEILSVTSESARIRFTTDECSGSTYVVHNVYSGSGGYPRYNECWTEHQLLVGSTPFTADTLKPSTTYTVDLGGVARNGVNGPLRTVTFTTLSEAATPAPTISNLKVDNLTPTSALVNFTSDQCVGSTFRVNGRLQHFDGFPSTDQCWLDHYANLGISPFTPGPLVPGTTYTVEVQVFRKSGISSATKIISFTTPFS